MGTVSCRTSSRFAASRLVKKVTPVMLPPGRFRLLTSPSFDRVTAEREYDRNRCGRGLGGKRGNRGDCADHGYLPAPLAGLAQTQSERGREGGVSRALERVSDDGHETTPFRLSRLFRWRESNQRERRSSRGDLPVHRRHA